MIRLWPRSNRFSRRTATRENDRGWNKKKGSERKTEEKGNASAACRYRVRTKLNRNVARLTYLIANLRVYFLLISCSRSSNDAKHHCTFPFINTRTFLKPWLKPKDFVFEKLSRNSWELFIVSFEMKCISFDCDVHKLISSFFLPFDEDLLRLLIHILINLGICIILFPVIWLHVRCRWFYNTDYLIFSIEYKLENYLWTKHDCCNLEFFQIILIICCFLRMINMSIVYFRFIIISWYEIRSCPNIYERKNTCRLISRFNPSIPFIIGYLFQFKICSYIVIKWKYLLFLFLNSPIFLNFLLKTKKKFWNKSCKQSSVNRIIS